MQILTALRRLTRQPALFGLVAGGLVGAFIAGASVAHGFHPSASASPLAVTASTNQGDRSAQALGHAVGRDVYSVQGAPIGRLTAVLRGSANEPAYALIATYDRDASVAGEIAIPLDLLSLRGEHLVFTTGRDTATADGQGQIRRWLM